MNLALFGGSFDPPHLGHDSIIKAVLSELCVDKLVIMPTFISPFKDGFSAPPELRLKWVRQIWGDLKNVEISSFECDQNRPVPTIESAKYLYKKYDITTLYIIIGADHLEALNRWHQYDELIKMAKFVVANRDKISLPSEFKSLNISADVSSSELRSGKKLEFLDSKIKDEIEKFYKG